MTAPVIPQVRPPDEGSNCPECTRRKETVRRFQNRLITVGQTLIGAGQATFAGTGIWQFVDSQWLGASAAAVLAALGYPAIKGLSKLRPKPRN
ncbi:hypothetical protein [Streptomyces sp. NPDC058614]|uniref:hypothetical protein n=1 Tax=Streptomyces sp. NPDC058614 TaxID=3346557 RepID=UPI00364BE712